MRRVELQIRDGLIFCSHTRVPGLDILLRKTTPGQSVDRDWLVVFGWIANRDEDLLREVEAGVMKAIEHLLGRPISTISLEDIRELVDDAEKVSVDLSMLR
ncbi:hypothetical protein [Polymorphum gilvum]|uniref:hypothetical protein n=1 Tax=Polymorphum gilvum TaxID=991904 RepID=UPI0011D287BC|nr:hypothetical protein [Polymorphum gilvum]